MLRYPWLGDNAQWSIGGHKGKRLGLMILQCIGGHNEQKCAGIINWMSHGEALHYYSWHLKIDFNNPWVKYFAEIKNQRANSSSLTGGWSWLWRRVVVLARQPMYCSLGGRYDNPTPEPDPCPSQRLRIWLQRTLIVFRKYKPAWPSRMWINQLPEAMPTKLSTSNSHIISIYSIPCNIFFPVLIPFSFWCCQPKFMCFIHEL